MTDLNSVPDVHEHLATDGRTNIVTANDTDYPAYVVAPVTSIVNTADVTRGAPVVHDIGATITSRPEVEWTPLFLIIPALRRRDLSVLDPAKTGRKSRSGKCCGGTRSVYYNASQLEYRNSGGPLCMHYALLLTCQLCPDRQ